MFKEAELAAFIAHDLGSSPRLAYAIVRNCESATTYEYVANQMGVSIDRAKKACNVLRNVGLITITYPYHAPAQLAHVNTGH